MDAKRNRNKMLADTNESGYVWTGPKMSSKNDFRCLMSRRKRKISLAECLVVVQERLIFLWIPCNLAGV